MDRKSSPLIRVVIYSLLLVAVGLTLRAQLQKLSARSQSRVSYRTRVGEALPPFEIADVSGKTWRSTDLKGKTVYMNVWASW